MNLLIIFLKGFRKVYMRCKTISKWLAVNVLGHKVDDYTEQLYEKYVELFDQQANDCCNQFLSTGKPCMISKFGTIELSALLQYKYYHQKSYSFRDYLDYLDNKIPSLWWCKNLNALCSNAGFFPNDITLLPKYYEVNLQAMKKIDILGSYIYGEASFKDELQQAKKINIDGYYAPFYYDNPWTKALKGKRVLVVHPFEKSIQNQYKRRELIWNNSDVLPDFDLITIKAEQTMLGQPSQFATWFDALESMKLKMNEIEFDIALIGAGAYGMPLAAYAKELGKQAVHLAGWTQVLFGIKGKRWVDMPSVAKYMNEYWVNPLPEEAPQNFKKVENGCYW